MFLFLPEHRRPIVMGEKTETRRKWPHGRRAVPGSQHQCRTKMFDRHSAFGLVQVQDVHQEELREITDEGAQREGYADRAAYFQVWGRLYGDVASQLHDEVWVVRFHLVALPHVPCGGAGCEDCDDGFVEATDEAAISYLLAIPDPGQPTRHPLPHASYLRR